MWSKLKFLHASYTILSKAFHYIRNLQNPLALELLDMKKEYSLDEDQSIKLNTSLSNEVYKALYKPSTIFENNGKKMHETREVTYSPETMHTTNIFHSYKMIGFSHL